MLSENIINDVEFLRLDAINTSKNTNLHYYNYDFEVDKLSDDKCLVEFRSPKNDIYELAETLDLSEKVKYYNEVKVDGMEA